jgi:hypothetical protein
MSRPSSPRLRSVTRQDEARRPGQAPVAEAARWALAASGLRRPGQRPPRDRVGLWRDQRTRHPPRAPPWFPPETPWGMAKSETETTGQRAPGGGRPLRRLV